MSAASEPFQILVVCTGNICRSPVGELLLRQWLQSDGAKETIKVSSAGTEALVGHHVHSEMATLLTRDGIDSASFVSRQVTRELLHESDLVLTATRDHRQRVVKMVPAMLRRTFTLREFARLCGLIEPPIGTLTQQDRFRVLRDRAPLMRGRMPAARGDDDVADPMGGDVEAFRESYALIGKAVADILGAI